MLELGGRVKLNKPPEKPADKKKPQSDQNSPVDADLSARLDDLGSRIQSKRKEKITTQKKAANSTSSGVAQAMRLSSEFIAAICVGAGIGYLIDRFAGTSPWGIIVFLLLGFGAGVLNVLRVAGLVAETNMHFGAGAGENDKE